MDEVMAHEAITSSIQQEPHLWPSKDGESDGKSRLTTLALMHEDRGVMLESERTIFVNAEGKHMTTTKRRAEAEHVRAQETETVSARNPGMALDMDWVSRVHINRSAVERRAATLATRRTVKKEWQAAWLLRAITCIDLTTLAGDDTPGNVLRLCAKARQPVRQDVLAELGVSDLALKVGAVCVYHNLVPVAVEALRGTTIPVA